MSQETGGGEAAVRKAYGPKLHQRLQPTLSNEWISALKLHKDFLLKWGFIAADFDIDTWIVLEPFAEAQKLIKITELGKG